MQKKKDSLPDIQRRRDRRGIGINRVGVENIDFPLLIATKDKRKVLVYAKIDLFSSLKHGVKGTNMSRFLETLMKYRYEVMNKENLEHFLRALKKKLGNVKDVYTRINFKYFIKKTSPISRKESVMSYECTFEGKLSKRFHFKLRTKVLTTSNCPCSKEISKFGAHGQRSISTVTVEPMKGTKVWLEDIIGIVENAGSCEVYPLLKRTDEKYVTEKAYMNPKFVEDTCRDIAIALQQLKTIRWFRIKVCNEESIHPSNAVSYVERHKKGKRWRKYSGSLRKIT